MFNSIYKILVDLGITGWVIFAFVALFVFRDSLLGLFSNLHTLKFRDFGVGFLNRSDSVALSSEVAPSSLENGKTQNGRNFLEFYWLGHDLSWTQTVILAQGRAVDIAYGLRQSSLHMTNTLGVDSPTSKVLLNIVQRTSSFSNIDWTTIQRQAIWQDLESIKHAAAKEIQTIVDTLQESGNNL